MSCAWGLGAPVEKFSPASWESAAASWPGLRDRKGVRVGRSQGKSETHSNRGPERTGCGRLVQEEDRDHAPPWAGLWTATGLRLGGRRGEEGKEPAAREGHLPVGTAQPACVGSRDLGLLRCALTQQQASSSPSSRRRPAPAPDVQGRRETTLWMIE